MIVLGVDPDLHDTALALVELPDEPGARPRLVAVSVASIPRVVKHEEAAVLMSRVLSTKIPSFIFFVLAVRPFNAAVVEGQDFHPGRNKASPIDIIRLAKVAGAALASVPAPTNGEGAEFMSPFPVEWKGSVPKEIHQARVLDELGLPRTRTREGWRPAHQAVLDVIGASAVRDGQWIHLVDAAGLALWGSWQIRKARAVERAKARARGAADE